MSSYQDFIEGAKMVHDFLLPDFMLLLVLIALLLMMTYLRKILIHQKEILQNFRNMAEEDKSPNEVLETRLWRKISNHLARVIAKKDEAHNWREIELFQQITRNMEEIVRLHIDHVKVQHKIPGSPLNNTCHGCGSRSHWIRNCPHSSNIGPRFKAQQQRYQQMGSYPTGQKGTNLRSAYRSPNSSP